MISSISLAIMKLTPTVYLSCQVHKYQRLLLKSQGKERKRKRAYTWSSKHASCNFQHPARRGEAPAALLLIWCPPMSNACLGQSRVTSGRVDAFLYTRGSRTRINYRSNITTENIEYRSEDVRFFVYASCVAISNRKAIEVERVVPPPLIWMLREILFCEFDDVMKSGSK
jgi:hypothetical protein